MIRPGPRCSRPAVPACWPWAMCAAARSSGSPPQWVKGRWPYAWCTNIWPGPDEAPGRDRTVEENPMLDSLGRQWWAVALRGVAAVLFGLMALLWPGITLFVLVLLFGAYALVDGVFTLVAAIRGRGAAGADAGGRGWLVARGLSGIALGV